MTTPFRAKVKNQMMNSVTLILIAVMLAAGAFGGLINYFVTVKSDAENASIRKSIVIGIGASFLMPLFPQLHFDELRLPPVQECAGDIDN